MITSSILLPSISKYEHNQAVINDKLQKINELREQIANQGETPDITVIANLTSQIEENTAEKWDNAVLTKPVCVSDMHAWLKAHPGAFIAAMNP